MTTTLFPVTRLRAELKGLVFQAREILDRAKAENRAKNPDEDKRLKELNGEMDELEQAIAEREALDARGGIRPEVPEQTPRPVAHGSRYLDVRTGKEIRAFAPNERITDSLDIPPEDRNLSVGRFLRGLCTGNWKGAAAELRLLQDGSFTGGGALVPTPLSAQLIDLARSRSVVIRAGARTIPMDSSTLRIARVASDPSGTWFGEEVRTSGIPESEGSFGALELTAHTFAFLERVSLEAWDDIPNFDAVLENQVAQAAALGLDKAVLFGVSALGWSGLRGNPDPWGINEISMGTNGAAITDFSKFVEAIQKLYEGNFAGELGALRRVVAPRTWGTLAGFKEATTNAPLAAPQAVRDVPELVSTQLPVDEVQGSASNASTAFVGDFGTVLVAVRTSLTVEVSRTAKDAFERLHVLLRGYLRADWAIEQPKHMTRIVGIIP